jgi:catechol 2,3-dioxygenase-like lactoylglutathione lyase family enzyme
VRSVLALDHVQVSAPAGGEESARRFYSGLVGLPELSKPPVLAARGGVWFAAGEQALHVGIDPAFRPASRAHPAFRLDDGAALDALAGRLAEAGREVDWNHDLPGERRFYSRDPFGNRVEFLAAEATIG